MADIVHRSSRTVKQDPEVVHERLLELGKRLKRELPAIPAGSQAATLLGTSGSLGLEIDDKGADRIELRTTKGRIRGEGSVDIEAAGRGKTTVSMVATVKPHGFGAGVMMSAALASRPSIQKDIVKGLERGFDDLAKELAKPDHEWDAASWTPPGLPD